MHFWKFLSQGKNIGSVIIKSSVQTDFLAFVTCRLTADSTDI